MKKYLLQKGKWEQDFEYVYSLVAKSRTQFIQEQDSVKNSFNEDINLFNYVSIAHKEKQLTGVNVTVQASFDNFGAPAITFANSIGVDENGYKLYGDHYEVVIYEDGCNVWFVTATPDNPEASYLSTLCGELHFGIDTKKVTLSVTVKDGAFDINIDKKNLRVKAPMLNNSFYVGLTACEGINHFYSAEIK